MGAGQQGTGRKGLMNIAGYLRHTKEGPIGEPGSHYSYLLASNGLFVEAENEQLQATHQIAKANVRGLADLQEKLVLKHGRIPSRLFGDAMKFMAEDLDQELYLAIVHNGSRYLIEIPYQHADGARVVYDKVPNTVLDLHSHPTFHGLFSGQDDRDEVGLQLYGVIGMLHTLMPDYTLRTGVYGYFRELKFEEVFAP